MIELAMTPENQTVTLNAAIVTAAVEKSPQLIRPKFGE
jgi:hypothetical protein